MLVHEPSPPSSSTPPSCRSTSRRRDRRAPPCRPRHPRRGVRARHASRSPSPPARAGHPPCSVHRDPERQLAGFYRRTFTDDDGVDRTHRHHPVRGDRRPPGVPLLRRARPKAVFAVTLDVTRRPLGLLEPPGPPTSAARRRRAAGPLRRHHDDVDLPRRLRRRAPRGDRAGRSSTGSRAVVHVPGKGDLTAFALEVAAHALAFFTDCFGIPYPADKLDLSPSPTSPSGPWRTWAASPSARPRCSSTPQRARALELERVAEVVAPRDRPHVVRRPRHDEVVERHLAERGLRHLHGAPLRRRLPPRVGRWVSFGTEREMALAIDGAALHPARRVPGRAPRGSRGHVRRPHLREGRRASCACWSSYLGRRRFRDGVRRYLQRTAYGNTETTDLWDAIEEASGEPVRGDHGQLDPPGRLSRSSRGQPSGDGGQLR